VDRTRGRDCITRILGPEKIMEWGGGKESVIVSNPLHTNGKGAGGRKEREMADR